MSQYGRPITDITNVGWIPIPVYAQIDEVSPDDGDYVISSADPGTSSFEVRLTELAQPEFGSHTLSVRLDKTDLGDLPVTIELLQGGSVVATRLVPTPTLSFHTYDFTLTDIEIGAITDYANLRLRVTVTSQGNSSSSSATSDQSGTSGGSQESSTTSGQSDTSGGSEESSTTSGQSGTSETSGESSAASDQSGSSEGSTGSSSTQSSTSGDSTSSTTFTSQSSSSESSTGSSESSSSRSTSSTSGHVTQCCENAIPSILYATITNVGCSCINGISCILTFEGGSWNGIFDLTPCGPENQLSLTFSCDNNIWRFLLDGCIGIGSFAETASCDPFEVQSRLMAVSGCGCPVTGMRIVVTS